MMYASTAEVYPGISGKQRRSRSNDGGKSDSVHEGLVLRPLAGRYSLTVTYSNPQATHS